MSDDGTTSTQPTNEPAELWFVAEQRRLFGMPGYRALALMDRVKRIAYIFQANVAQYKALAACLQDPGFSLPIMDTRNPDAHDELLSEAERLLHNVLTAMSTRVDQLRVFTDKHFAHDAVFQKAYKDRISSDFHDDRAATFLKFLRNHLTHQGLPVGESNSSMSATSYEVTFILPVAPLLEWKWNTQVMTWITGHGDDIPIVDIVDSYAAKVGTFDHWLYELIGEKYRTEIDEYRHAETAYLRKHDQAFGI
jgi:hypothetical protein